MSYRPQNNCKCLKASSAMYPLIQITLRRLHMLIILNTSNDWDTRRTIESLPAFLCARDFPFCLLLFLSVTSLSETIGIICCWFCHYLIKAIDPYLFRFFSLCAFGFTVIMFSISWLWLCFWLNIDLVLLISESKSSFLNFVFDSLSTYLSIYPSVTIHIN